MADCVDFHGHACSGLLIGYQAARYATALLDLQFSADEEVVCIAENDACDVDAIQVMLGCSVGKGNLLFHMTGKYAFSFYNRLNGKAARLLLRPRPASVAEGESFAYYWQQEPQQLFDVMPPRLELPEAARFFQSYPCDGCGEMTGANWLHLQGEQKLCPDCYRAYNRFDV